MGSFLSMETSSLSFLTHEEVPANTVGLRVGDRVVLEAPRPVVRVGYRLRASDLLPEARELIRSPEADAALRGLLKAVCPRAWEPELRLEDPLLGAAAESANLSTLRQETAWAVARTLVEVRHFGGRERGIHVRSPQMKYHGIIDNKRTVYVGVRYPPTGSEDDYEDGGLHPRRAVVLVQVNGCWYMSGDVRLVCPARCGGRYIEGAYVHADRCSS